jgi:molybdopterin/thiamine biosynthesis adenylyltransferase
MKITIERLLAKYARVRTRPDGSSYTAMLYRDETHIAKRTGLSVKDVEIAALKNDIVPERYCRNQKTLTNKEQIKLLESHVVVVGQGGLGGTVTEILARIGIGSLTLVDGDFFEDSNLNRQLLATTESLGQKKAEAARARVRLINPAIDILAIPDFFREDNGMDILQGADLAVDCLDSIPDRFVVENSCRKSNIPLVSAAIGGTSGQATVIFPGDPGLRQIYGEPKSVPQKGIETQLGTLPYAAVFMAAIECAEVVSIICTNSSQLQNSLLITNIADQSVEKILLPKT